MCTCDSEHRSSTPGSSAPGRRRRSPPPGRTSAPTVTLTSTSANTEGGTFDSLLWDFDADGQYDDASGAIVSHTFLTSGTRPGRPAGQQDVRRLGVDATDDPNQSPPDPHRRARARTPCPKGAALRWPPPRPTRRDALDYRWDLNGDRTFESTGQTTTFTALGARRASDTRCHSPRLRLLRCLHGCDRERSRDQRAAAGERRTGQAGESRGNGSCSACARRIPDAIV